MSSTNSNYAAWPIPQEINANFNGPASLAIGIQDLLYWDTSGLTPLPFSSAVDLGSAALMQAFVAKNFLGVSNSAQISTDATQRPVRIVIDKIIEFPCPSQTFVMGDLVGAYYSANVLSDQQVTRVAYPHLAVGKVIKAYASNTTVVQCRLLSRHLLGGPTLEGRGGMISGHGSGVIPDAATTLTVDTPPTLTCVPTAARTHTLPAAAEFVGGEIRICNNSAGAFSLTVQDPTGPTTVGVIPQNKRGIFWNDGTTWYGMVSA